ncbi:MAG: SMI1/KNR4 family protein [Anaerolineae bacterium]|nr:SMI1/KNR4 family protein [Anaerolineae bacterium]
MKIDDITIVGRPLVLATAAEVDALASRLWITFPVGYREFVTRLGEGIFGGSFVRIYPPWRIAKELQEWRHRIKKYWFWDDDGGLLPKARAIECVIIGDTLNGDELVFHPTRPDHLFILPRNSDRAIDAGSDLLEVIEWICKSGQLVEPFDEQEFEPFDSRDEALRRQTKRAIIDPEGESLDDIVALAERWAQRHAARKTAEEKLPQHIPKNGEAALLYEGVLIDGQAQLDVGYGIAWLIRDKVSGKLLRISCWRKGEGHQGWSFVPQEVTKRQVPGKL